MSSKSPRGTSLSGEPELAQTSLPPELLALLRCTSCKALLVNSEGDLSCSACGRRFPEVRGVLRFVAEGNYADSFGYQWRRFQRTQLDDADGNMSERDFIRKTGLQPEDLKGKLVLDVGCGSMGVLHHTPDCEKAVKTLPQYLKPGGTLAVWLYSGYNKWYRFSDQYRKITHRLSPRVLHGFFRVAVPFFYWLDRGLRVIPLIGKPVAGLVHHVFPVNRHRDPEIRVLDTLDWYSPKYQSKHTYEQVFRWFESCGLESLSVGNFAVGVRGRKPLGNGRP